MRFGLASKYFPLPKFLKPSHLGISFSDPNIKAIYFDKTQEEPALKSMTVPLEKGAIISGSIVNMPEVISKLSLIKQEFGTNFAFFAVPDELTYVFSSELAVSSGSNAAESVAFIIEENVPLSLNETIFDFLPTEIKKDSDKYKANFVVAAGVQKEIMKFTEALQKSGFDPVGCVHESQAVAASIIPKNYSGICQVVHARAGRVGIYLVIKNLVYFSTLRAISGGDYKKEFLDEYHKFTDYCLKLNYFSEGSTEHVLVCGEFESAKAAIEALLDSASGPKEVKLANVWSNVFKIDKHIPEIPYEESLNFAGPIGAVLSDII